MPSTLKRLRNQSVGLAPSTLTTGSETGPASGRVWNVPRLYITNTHISGTPTVTVNHMVGASGITVVVFKMGAKGTRDSTLILENIVMLNGDSIQVSSDTSASIDVYGSIMEEDA